MRFEWDERKRLANLAKHGLDFRRAVQVFDRPSFSYPWLKQYEQRWGRSAKHTATWLRSYGLGVPARSA
jgi:uncharacterized DUF497 family protein